MLSKGIILLPMLIDVELRLSNGGEAFSFHQRKRDAAANAVTGADHPSKKPIDEETPLRGLSPETRIKAAGAVTGTDQKIFLGKEPGMLHGRETTLAWALVQDDVTHSDPNFPPAPGLDQTVNDALSSPVEKPAPKIKIPTVVTEGLAGIRAAREVETPEAAEVRHEATAALPPETGDRAKDHATHAAITIAANELRRQHPDTSPAKLFEMATAAVRETDAQEPLEVYEDLLMRAEPSFDEVLERQRTKRTLLKGLWGIDPDETHLPSPRPFIPRLEPTAANLEAEAETGKIVTQVVYERLGKALSPKMEPQSTHTE